MIMELEYRSFIDQLVHSTRRCNESEAKIEKLVNVKDEMLSPVFEDFCNNLRRMDAYHSDAQTTYFLYKNQIQTFNCMVNNIDYYWRHGFVPVTQIRIDLENKGIIVERRNSAQQEYMGKLEGLLAGAKIVIDNTWENFYKERESQMPKTSKSYHGSVVIEEMDEDSGVYVENDGYRTSPVIVATNEVSQLKQEMMKMQLQMDQILEILQKPQNVVVVGQAETDKKAPAETKAPKHNAMEWLSQVAEMKQKRETDEHRSENGRGRRDQKNGHHENSPASEPNRETPAQNGQNHSGRYYEDENTGELKKDDNVGRYDREFDERPRKSDQKNGQNSHASESNREEPSQNGKHYGGRSYEFEDQVDKKRNDNGNRFEDRRYDERPRRSDQGSSQSSHDQRYDSELPRTNEDDRRDYGRDHRRYQHSRERPFNNNNNARRSESPRRQYYDDRAHHESDRHTPHDQSPIRSSRTRAYSPARSNGEPRNNYEGYNSGRRSQAYDDRRYTGPHHPGDNYSRESSCTRGYSPQNQSPFYDLDEAPMMNARPPSNAGPAPSKQHENPNPQGFKKQRRGSTDDFCAYCKRPGHNKDHCPKKKCSNCGGFGHKAAVCTSKKQQPGRNN